MHDEHWIVVVQVMCHLNKALRMRAHGLVAANFCLVMKYWRFCGRPYLGLVFALQGSVEVHKGHYYARSSLS